MTSELGVDRELLGERHLAVADHEQADGEEEQTAEHEDADAHKARGAGHLSSSLRTHEGLDQRLGARVERLSVPCASMRPSWSTAKSSPITRALGMLCVTTTSVVPPLLGGDQEVVDLGRGNRIEPGARLVDEQDRRVERHRPRQPGALLHAAGQIAGHLVVRRLEADGGELLPRLLAHVAARELRVPSQRERDVVADRHRIKERRILKQEPHVLTHLPELAPAHVRDVALLDEDAAAIRLHQADDVPERDALAGAAPAEQAERRARRDRGTKRRRARRAVRIVLTPARSGSRRRR